MSLFNFIKSQLSISDVISEYVTIKRAGNYWKGPCPFHFEKDASFTVSPDKQIFYCFGCHASGDVIAFIARAENLTQREAVTHIIDRYGISVPDNLKSEYKGSGNADLKDRYIHLCKQVAHWAHQKLRHCAIAQTYLAERGVNATQIQTFLLGYFPGGVQQINLFIKDMATQNILLSDLLDAGILIAGKGSTHSPFEERILFPIKDALGRFVGFGGRTFDAHDTRPKYYNSKESEVFLKRKLMFGLDLAKKAIQTEQSVFLVEGYMDCVAMIQYGYHNTIATLGTSCTADHLKILTRYAKTVYVLYDGDKAGQAAILRLTELCWDSSLDLMVVGLPPKEDPASLLMSGQSLAPYIEKATDIFSFFVKTIGSDFLKKPLSDKLDISKKIIEVISHLTDPFKQELLLQQASVTMQIPQESLKGLLRLIKAPAKPVSSQAGTPQAPLEDKGEFTNLEEKIFSAILSDESNLLIPTTRELGFSESESDLFSCFSDKVLPIIKEFLKLKKEYGTQRAFDKLCQTLAPEDAAWVIQCSVSQKEPMQTEEFNMMLDSFRRQQWKQKVNTLKAELMSARSLGDNAQVQALLETFSKLKQEAKNRGLV